jgi:hypothetical protein
MTKYDKRLVTAGAWDEQPDIYYYISDDIKKGMIF